MSVRGESDWFETYMRSDQYMYTQGGWVDDHTHDIFMFAMQGLKQKWIPLDLEVEVVRTDEIHATIPYRDRDSPYGHFSLNVYKDMLNVALYHPHRVMKTKHWTHTFSSVGQFRDLPWKEWNMYLELIE